MLRAVTVKIIFYHFSISFQVTATNIYKLLSTLGSSHLGDVTTKFSINYTDHSYIVCLANKKINIVKKSASDIFV